MALKHGKLVCVQLPSIQPIWQIVGIDFDAQALTIDESMSSVLLGNSYGKVISIPLE